MVAGATGIDMTWPSQYSLSVSKFTLKHIYRRNSLMKRKIFHIISGAGSIEKPFMYDLLGW